MAKNTISNVKRQRTNCEKIFPTCYKGLISLIQNSCKLKEKKDQTLDRREQNT